MIIGNLIQFIKSSSKSKNGITALRGRGRNEKKKRQQRVYTTGVYFDTSERRRTTGGLGGIPLISPRIENDEHGPSNEQQQQQQPQPYGHHGDVLKQVSMHTLNTEATTMSHHQNFEEHGVTPNTTNNSSSINHVQWDDAWIPSYLENHNDNVPVLVYPKPGMVSHSKGLYYGMIEREEEDEKEQDDLDSSATSDDDDAAIIRKEFNKKRLEAFYMVHNPEKINTINKSLTKYKGREDVFFDKMKKKYGEEEHSMTKPWLIEFYTHYNPHKLDQIETILDKYAGREVVLYSKLMKQYNGNEDNKKEATKETPSQPRFLARQKSNKLIVNGPADNEDTTTTKSDDALDRTKLKQMIVHAWKYLPEDSDNYSSNYIMINTHRCHHLIPTVHRERYLDTIAREHAHSMASEQTLFQISTPYEIHHKLQVLQEHDETNTYANSNTTFTRIGVNIGKGKSIMDIHTTMIHTLAEKNNIQDKRFFKMGMATAHDIDGTMYLCQIFGG